MYEEENIQNELLPLVFMSTLMKKGVQATLDTCNYCSTTDLIDYNYDSNLQTIPH